MLYSESCKIINSSTHTRIENNRKKYREVKIMREGIHPNYHQATVTCNCGNTFVTGSTKEDIHVEICSKCHPFYTGQQKAAQARGRIDKFNRKYGLNK
jgi:large subunit ribosomal protein L31